MSTRPSTIIGAASSTHQPLMILSSSAAMLPASDGIHRSIWVGVADRDTRNTLVTGDMQVPPSPEYLFDTLRRVTDRFDLPNMNPRAWTDSASQQLHTLAPSLLSRTVYEQESSAQQAWGQGVELL